MGRPESQRPFIWKNSKVRDLFDSMMRGYPIGYLMLWECPTLEKNQYVLNHIAMMLLREDIFCNGSFDQRVESGQVECIVH